MLYERGAYAVEWVLGENFDTARVYKCLLRRRNNDETKVTKAIFPVAGLGTRFLPATKSVPKEIMTLVDRHLSNMRLTRPVPLGSRSSFL